MKAGQVTAEMSEPPLDKTQGMISGWTIYDRPNGQPDRFVARRWFTLDGKVVQTNDVVTAPTLDEIRALMPTGFVRFARHGLDDPSIVEVWL